MQRFNARPAFLTSSSRSGFNCVRVFEPSAQTSAVMVPLPGSASPSASARQFIELAVNIPEQLPQPGQAFSARSRSPASESLPTLCLPTPSKMEIKSVPPAPASIGPPLT